jgi:hypothetical protein
LVGALNVGSIKLDFYDKLSTNLRDKNSYKITEYYINK